MTETLQFVPSTSVPPMSLAESEWMDMLFAETDLELQFDLDDLAED